MRWRVIGSAVAPLWCSGALGWCLHSGSWVAIVATTLCTLGAIAIAVGFYLHDLQVIEDRIKALRDVGDTWRSVSAAHTRARPSDLPN